MDLDAGPSTPLNIHTLPTTYLPASPPPPEPYAPHRAAHTPIVIDNGATTLRWGFGTSSNPAGTGPNAVAKYKERRTNKPCCSSARRSMRRAARAARRARRGRATCCELDALENALDYAFINLGIDTPTVDHPVLMTERLCSPLHSRAPLLRALLTYCIDGIMSFYQNNPPPPAQPFAANGLVVSFNTASTSFGKTVRPIPAGGVHALTGGRGRIPWGAAQSSEYLLKLIQLKYPTFPTRVTNVQTNWMLHNFCEVATDFNALLRTLQDPLKLRASEVVVQFPFALPVAEEKTEEELAKIAEKRREQGRKLQELAAKTRVEKLLQKESDLQYLTALKESKATESKREWMQTPSRGPRQRGMLDETIKKLESDLKKARKKEAGETDEITEEPSFPLVDVPMQMYEKKKQRLMKAGFDARVRARREKEREREERETQERREEAERDEDLGGWARKLRQEQEALMAKIKDRARRKAALTDRKSAAAQARMKNIASLAADDRVPRRKSGKGAEDMFGADDEDWAIYRKINTQRLLRRRGGPRTAADDRAETTHARPDFTPKHTHAAITTQRSALMSAFRPVYQEGDIEGNTRIHLNTERYRVCEAYFSPAWRASTPPARRGHPEPPPVLRALARARRVLDYPEDRTALIQNVFLTGAPSVLPGLEQRLRAVLQSLLPPGAPLTITRAADPALDAWRGMAAFSRSDAFRRGGVGVSRAEYEEHGGERIKRWWGGNWNAACITISEGAA
ncbi:chromatin remodeling complex subunit [Pholiota molesta]|nr:chromatin remodeling complex subunit [Pholiota molesta]